MCHGLHLSLGHGRPTGACSVRGGKWLLALYAQACALLLSMHRHVPSSLGRHVPSCSDASGFLLSMHSHVPSSFGRARAFLLCTNRQVPPRSPPALSPPALSPPARCAVMCNVQLAPVRAVRPTIHLWMPRRCLFSAHPQIDRRHWWCRQGRHLHTCTPTHQAAVAGAE